MSGTATIMLDQLSAVAKSQLEAPEAVKVLVRSNVASAKEKLDD